MEKNVMKRSSRRMFTVIFTIASILINCMCSYLAGLIAFPLYLDSLLTIAVTALCGLIPGLFLGFRQLLAQRYSTSKQKKRKVHNNVS